MKLTPIAYSLALAGLACSVNVQAASVYTWTGAGANSNLGTSANWLGSSVPTSLTDATLIFNAGNVVGAGFKSVNNNLLNAPVYGALQFTNGGMTIGGTQTIALRPTSSTNFTVISNTGGNNTISAPLRFDTNTVSGVVLDNARIAVTDYSLTLAGAVSANQVNLSTSLGANATLSMNNVTAKSFEANGGTHNLSGVLTASSVSLLATNLNVSGAGGSINATGGTVSVGAGAQLTLDNTAAASNNRVSGSVVVNDGATLLLKGNATTDVAQTVLLGSGGFNYESIRTIKVEGAGANVLLTLDKEYGYYGLTNYASNGVLGDKERIKFATAPMYQPYGLMVRAMVNGQEFASYGADKGVVSATNATSLVGASVTSNVFINSAANLTGNTTINSLAVNSTNITGGAADVISLASGRLLTSGTVSIAPVVDFGATSAEIITQGNTVLAGGVKGSDSLGIRGAGSLELQSAGGFSGSVWNSSQLTLSADNVLQGARVGNNGVLNLGNTTQSFSSLSSYGDITGTGKIVAAGDITLNQNLVNVSLEGKDVSVNWNVSPSNLTVNGNIHATQGVYLGNGVMNGVIFGAAYVRLEGTTLTNQNTYTGSTAGNLILSGNGAIVASSGFNDGGLTMRAGNGDNGSLDRIGNAAAIWLYKDGAPGSGVLSLQGSGSVAMHEDIGVLNTGAGARLEMANGTGTTSLRADALNVYNGDLTLSLGDTSSFYVDLAPGTYTNTNVVKDVYVEKLIDGKLQRTWAAYDAGNGRISEALVLEKTLNSAGSDEFVRVTDATNQALISNRTVGAVNINTNQDMNGSGILTVGSGQLLFWKDNTINVAGLNFGSQQGVVINTGTNTINSVISGENGLIKKGAGTLVLTANNTITGYTEVREGSLSVASGGRIGDVFVSEGAAVLNLAGTANSIYNMGTVNLNTAYNNTAGSVINGYGALHANAGLMNQGTIHNVVHNASSVTNSGYIAQIINNGILTNAVGAGIGNLTHNSATAFTNHGDVYSIENSGVVTNEGTVSEVWSNSGTFINNGTLNQIRGNSGTFTNNGALVLDNSFIGGTFTNAGAAILNQGADAYSDWNAVGNAAADYRQTAGTTTINGGFQGNIILEAGTLNGSGNIFGSLTVKNGAQVNPGNSPGLLTIDGKMVLDMGSVLNMEVIYENGVLKYDQLAVFGDPSIGNLFTNNGVIKFSLGTGVDFSNNEFSANGQKANLANIFILSDYNGVSMLSYLLGDTLLVLDANGNSHNWLVTAEMIAASPLTAPVPVPAAAWLLGSGLLGLIGVARRKAIAA